MKKIEKLTQEQEKLMYEVRDEWMNFIFSCKNKLDKEKATIGINNLYKLCKLDKPKIIWLSSPLGLQYASNILYNDSIRDCIMDSINYSLWNSIKDSVRNPVDRSVMDSVNYSVEDSVGDSVYRSVMDSVDRSVRGSVNYSIRSSVYSSIRDSVNYSVEDSVGDSVRGSVNYSVWDSVYRSVWDSVYRSVEDSVDRYVRDSVGDSVRDSVMDSVRGSIMDSINHSVWNSIRDSVMDPVYRSVEDSVDRYIWDSIMDSVNYSVEDSVNYSVEDSVWDPVYSSVRDSVDRSVMDSVEDLGIKFYSFTPYGQISDYGWVAFFDFFTRIGVLDHKEFNDFKNLLKSGIYDMIIFNGVCLVCELPIFISKDNVGRLHNEKKHCIEWSDGFKLWKWKGFDVPKKLIETPELITKEDLKQNQNAEIRRAFIEKLGVTNYFNILSDGEGLKLVDKDNDDQGFPMKLMQFSFEDKKIQVLEVTCPSTQRIYNLYPPNQKSKNVWEAKASTVKDQKLMYRHGDVGVQSLETPTNKPLIET